MKPTKSLDIRIQAILDSRDLAMAYHCLSDRGMSVYSVSDLVRKCIQLAATLAINDGHNPIHSRESAHIILREFSQRGRGYDTHPSYNTNPTDISPSYSSPFKETSNDHPTPSSEDIIDKFLMIYPDKTREEAMIILEKVGKSK